ncbi:MAG: pyroglutamyl-peptidase I [Oscillospiraceae bacterium]|nr:pyroglutamyl-peptidase I [Oscillospiraceae bacterium]
MRRLLITGFDPFGGGTVNPSWEAVKSLPDRVGEWELCKLAIPTVFGTAAELVLKRAEEFRPEVILCVGLAGGRDAVTPERIAVNIRDARIPDNAGYQPCGEFVVPGGPAAYFSTVPVTEMARAIRDAGIPAAVSNTAGTFVCNDVLYTILNRYAGTEVRAGFIHVPRLPEQGEPNLPLEKTVAALIAAIKVL